MFSGIWDGLLRNDLQPRLATNVDMSSLAAATHMLIFRYCMGRVVLDAHIRCEAWRCKQGVDPRDANLPSIDVEVKQLLTLCPASILIVSLVAWFCSPAHDGLRSRDAHVFSAATNKLYSFFSKMQEYGLGRLAGSGAEITFQKKHAAALKINSPAI